MKVSKLLGDLLFFTFCFISSVWAGSSKEWKRFLAFAKRNIEKNRKTAIALRLFDRSRTPLKGALYQLD